MEGRRQQHYDPVRDSWEGPDVGLREAQVPSYPGEDVHMEFHPPVEEPTRQDAQSPPPLRSSSLTPLPSDFDESQAAEDETMIPKIEFSTQWNKRKEAVWDIVRPNGTQSFAPTSAPKAHAAPQMWAENIYDAQDALPYFTAGQTILSSKIPRPVSRSVLLTRNLNDILVDWRSGKIDFTIKVRYKLQLNRPKKWQALSSPSKLVNVNCKPMDPIQFRKLRACYEGGIPVRVLATGDFPLLPIFQPNSTEEGWPASLSSTNWQNGVVMLGFFWVKKVEVNYSPDQEDLETGKCSGQSEWAFELLSCDTKDIMEGKPDETSLLPWWYPPNDDPNDYNAQGDDNTGDGELELGNASKRRRVGADVNPELCGDVSMVDAEKPDEKGGESTNNYGSVPNHPGVNYSCADPQLCNTGSVSGETSVTARADIDHPSNTGNLPEIRPDELGLKLEPIVGTDECLNRAPKLRASLLMGWLCSTCGKLNPRRKWNKDQLCPFCKTASTTLILPEWHRRAHTEAVGPIGTLFRLDDGGHQPKTGLHQMAARDEETGLTFVEYWLAEPPMPVIAELNRTVLVDRRKTRRKPAPPKTLEMPLSDITSSTTTPMSIPSNSIPVPSAPAPISLSANTQSTLLNPGPKDGVHPDGGQLIRKRDPGGSRAVFSEDTRMLFMQITCPQHPAGLALMDEIFSGFATDVQMERQENNASYRTGASALSSHYTYLAGCGTHIMHTSSPAVSWKNVPACVYNAHTLLVGYQTHTVFDDNKTVHEFNQNIFIVGNGATGTSTFRIIHEAGDGPVGYMVFGASCSIEVLVGNGENTKRTTKGGAVRRAEMLLAHGDALMTMPVKGDPPLEVRVKRTGLAVVSIACCVPHESTQTKKAQAASQERRYSTPNKMAMPIEGIVTPTKRKARNLRC